MSGQIEEIRQVLEDSRLSINEKLLLVYIMVKRSVKGNLVDHVEKDLGRKRTWFYEVLASLKNLEIVEEQKYGTGSHFFVNYVPEKLEEDSEE